MRLWKKMFLEIWAVRESENVMIELSAGALYSIDCILIANGKAQRVTFNLLYF